MKAYKGFNKDMTCTPIGGHSFQYEEGKTYHVDEAELCKSGFHACENPLDCFSYYSPATSVYHEVELEDVTNEKSDDSKRCGKTIKIGARLTCAKIVELSIDYVKSKCSNQTNNSGYGSVSNNSGNRSISNNSRDYSISNNSGDYSVSNNSGYGSVSNNSGYGSVSNNSGNRSVSNNSGDYSKSEVSGKDSIAVGVGYQNKAKACLGSAICLCERGDWNGKSRPLIAVKAAIVDGKTLKANTWYKLENGEFVECEDGEKK